MFAQEYHIKLGPQDVGKYVLLCGLGKRVEKIAKCLENSVSLGENREYNSYTGYLEDERITVLSSGIGGPATAIAVEELHAIGVRTIIRIGTCASLQPHIKTGSLIIPSGVVRGGKTASEYLPPEYPAVPHPEILYALLNSARAMRKNVHVGVTHCKDAFYKEDPEKMPDSEGVKNYWRILRKANVLSTEMESDTLFVLSSLRGVRAGAVFSAIGGVENSSGGTDVVGIEGAIRVAIDATRSLIRSDRMARESDSMTFPETQGIGNQF